MALSIPPDTQQENGGSILGWVVEPCGIPQDVARDPHVQVQEDGRPIVALSTKESKSTGKKVEWKKRAAVTDATPHLRGIDDTELQLPPLQPGPQPRDQGRAPH